VGDPIDDGEGVEVSTATDDLFDALSDGQRRHLLAALLDAKTTSELPVCVERYTEGSTRRELVRLHHVHLPKLDSLGFLTWDREAGVVSPGPAFEDARHLLEALVEFGAVGSIARP